MRTPRPTHADNPFAYDVSVWNAFGCHPHAVGPRLAADEWRQRVQNETTREALLRLAAESAPPPAKPLVRGRFAAARDALAALPRSLRLVAGASLTPKR